MNADISASLSKPDKADLVYAEVVASTEEGEKPKAKQHRLMYAQLQSEALEVDVPENQLYAQVAEGENTAKYDCTVEVEVKTQAGKSYAQVERKDFHILPTEPNSFPDHLYAKVDKKKKKVNAIHT